MTSEAKQEKDLVCDWACKLAHMPLETKNRMMHAHMAQRDDFAPRLAPSVLR